MPLDAVGFRPSLCQTLDNVGSIAEWRAQRWREHVENDYAMRRPRNRIRIQSGEAVWRYTAPFPLSRFPHNRFGRRAPKDVLRLAKAIQRVHPDARGHVQYFSTDPILYVTYGGERHCMAIWNHGIVRAIAYNAKLSWWQKVARRAVVTV